jgi:hypothetical protein
VRTTTKEKLYEIRDIVAKEPEFKGIDISCYRSTDILGAQQRQHE